MTQLQELVAERVERGASWLDANYPGWERRIDLSNFQMRRCDRCVIGQAVWAATLNLPVVEDLVLGEGEEVLILAKRASRFFYGGSWIDTPYSSPTTSNEMFRVSHGFDLEEWESETGVALEQAWTDLIKTRFNTGELSDA